MTIEQRCSINLKYNSKKLDTNFKMYFYTTFRHFVIFSIVLCVLQNNEAVAEGLEEFEREQIVPDVIDSVPPLLLNVTYDDDIEVNLGNVLTPMQTSNIPNITWDADPEKLFVLVMIDADVPSRKEPSLKEGQHYVVGNIPGMDISQGDVLTEYVGSGPPEGSGLHRYIFLLYEQSQTLTFEETRLTKNTRFERAKFSTRKFVEKYKLGKPIAGNFYQAEWTDAPHKSLKQHSEH